MKVYNPGGKKEACTLRLGRECTTPGHAGNSVEGLPKLLYNRFVPV